MGPDCDAGRQAGGGRVLRKKHRRPLKARPPRVGAISTALAVFFGLTGVTRAEQWNTLEYAVKAAFVYKFAPFVIWPGAAQAEGPFPVCVGGQDPVAPLIATVAHGQAVDGKPIDVRQVNSADETKGCAILYIASPGSRTARALLGAARGKPILTITDSGRKDEHGIIDFCVLGGHVRFNIDQNMAAESNLVISSKLLSLANAVTPRQNP